MEKVMSKQSFCWNGPVSVFLQFSHMVRPVQKRRLFFSVLRTWK